MTPPTLLLATAPTNVLSPPFPPQVTQVFPGLLSIVPPNLDVPPARPRSDLDDGTPMPLAGLPNPRPRFGRHRPCLRIDRHPSSDRLDIHPTLGSKLPATCARVETFLPDGIPPRSTPGKLLGAFWWDLEGQLLLQPLHDFVVDLLACPLGMRLAERVDLLANTGGAVAGAALLRLTNLAFGPADRLRDGLTRLNDDEHLPAVDRTPHAPLAFRAEGDLLLFLQPFDGLRIGTEANVSRWARHPRHRQRRVPPAGAWPRQQHPLRSSAGCCRRTRGAA